MATKVYPSDLSDMEWQQLESLIPKPKRGGRPPKWDRRDIINGIFYVLVSGCQWRMLPNEYPSWKTVFHYFREWRNNGTLARINGQLRRKLRTELTHLPESQT